MQKKKLPNSYKEMTVREWRSFCFIQPSEFESTEQYEEDVLDAFLNNYGYDYDEMDVEDIYKFSWIFKKIPKGEINDKVSFLKFIDYKRLTLADFIDIETNYQKGAKGYVNCIAVLLRRERTNKWGVKEIEPRKYSFSDRYDTINEMSVPDFITKVHEIGEYLTTTIKKFSSIFEKEYDEDEEINIQEEETHMEKMHKAFKWQKFVFFAADFDVTKQEKVLKMNANFLFNTLAMQKILKIYPK